MKSHTTFIELLAGIAMIAAFSVAACLVLFGFPQTSHGNPSLYIQTSGTSTTQNSLVATSSVAWQTAGNATSTIVMNGSLGTVSALDSATLLLYRKGSGGGSKTKVTVEYSQNCDATIPDWYVASTTNTLTTGMPFVNGFVWQFASSSIGSSVNPSDFDTIALAIPTPTKCLRAILSVPVGAASSSVWGELVAKRENN